MNEDELLKAIARVIGASYDGYCDPVDTPNNWARAMSAAKDVFYVLLGGTTSLITPEMYAAIVEANRPTRIG